MPFILSNMPSACRLRLPSIPSAGNLLGTTRTVHPEPSCPEPLGRYASTSEGVLFSLPAQNGQNPLFLGTGSRTKSAGRLARSVEIMTHRPTMGSFLNSGTASFLRSVGHGSGWFFLLRFIHVGKQHLPEKRCLRAGAQSDVSAPDANRRRSGKLRKL